MLLSQKIGFIKLVFNKLHNVLPVLVQYVHMQYPVFVLTFYIEKMVATDQQENQRAEITFT